ncbi:MAG: hypothetical protein ACYTFM_07200 [Planctomycetota bacterium]|jgi:hypothetical protein
MSENQKKALILTIFAVLILFIIIFAVLLDRPDPPVTFTSEKGRFTITFPSEPKSFTSHYGSDFGSYDIVGASTDANGIQFSIYSFDFSGNFPTSDEFWHADTQVDLSAQTFYARRQTLEHQGHPVVETRAKYLGGHLVYTWQIHFDQNRYTLQAVTRKDDQSHINQIQRFFNSLILHQLPQE